MNKKKKDNNIIWDFIDKHHTIIFLIIITFLAMLARGALLKYASGDYDMFLKPWFDSLKNYGGLPGLSKSIGNYTPIYMTVLSILTYFPIDSLFSIKIVSIIFDFLGAIIVYKIIQELLKDKSYKDKVSLLVYGLYLILPTILLNSAYWAQSDSIYTTFVLLSILYLIKKNYKLSIVFFAIALSFKLQAIFILPLYVLMYISERKIKLRYFLYIPLVIFILSIPKVIFSHDLLAGFRIYFDQMGSYKEYITLNFPNIYSIFLKGNGSNLINTPFDELATIGIIVTFIILVILAYLVYIKKTKFDKNAIIEFGLFSILITTFFLPEMHERYLFMGDVIALLYLVINAKKYYVPIMIEFISLNGYMYLLFSGFAINFSTLSIAYLVLIILYTKDMYLKYFKE